MTIKKLVKKHPTPWKISCGESGSITVFDADKEEIAYVSAFGPSCGYNMEIMRAGVAAINDEYMTKLPRKKKA